MNFLPKASGTRPRVACEIAPEGVIAARSAAGTVLDEIGSAPLGVGALAPGLRPVNVVERVAVVGAVRRALEDAGAKPNARNADVTVIIPDGACRVLLLEFDTLPGKLTEALPLIRFRLKKLLPFDADDAMVSFQVMSQSRQMVRVLAVAIPRDVLAEYESLLREAGFEPGAVLPSTLAAMAAVDDAAPSLVINVNRLGVTAAIAREGILLLHRAVDLQAPVAGIPADFPPALFEPSLNDARADAESGVAEFARLPLVSREDSAAEWASQQPLPEHGRNPYADRADDEQVVQDFDGITGLPLPRVYNGDGDWRSQDSGEAEPGAIERSPYNSPTLLADLNAEKHFAMLDTPPLMPTAPTAGLSHTPQPQSSAPVAVEEMAASRTAAADSSAVTLSAPEFGDEVAQAVSVATAYFEDTLGAVPEVILCAGALGTDGLERVLVSREMSDGLRLREIVPADALAAGAASAAVPRARLAGVLGALRG